MYLVIAGRESSTWWLHVGDTKVLERARIRGNGLPWYQGKKSNEEKERRGGCHLISAPLGLLFSCVFLLCLLGEWWFEYAGDVCVYIGVASSANSWATDIVKWNRSTDRNCLWLPTRLFCMNFSDMVSHIQIFDRLYNQCSLLRCQSDTFFSLINKEAN